MRRQSKKRSAQARAIKPVRDAFRAEHHLRCMACGAHGGEVHEMTSGTAGRPLGEIEPATWLLACNDCNCNRLTDKAAWPVARQLALKLLCDFERFDLGKFNACYTLGRIHMEDVLRWLTLA